MLSFEEGIRGGVSVIGHRYSQANSKHLDNYDQTKPSKYIIDNDVNNIYGTAMLEKLPYSGFEWMTRKEMDDIDVSCIGGNMGCALEADLEYPKDLYDLHNAYPLAPERLAVDDDMLSDYARGLKTTDVKDLQRFIVASNSIKLLG